MKSFAYISQYADIPHFRSTHSVRETYKRLRTSDLPLLYCVGRVIWWFFYCESKGVTQSFGAQQVAKKRTI